ncbi:heat shock protein HtpX [Micromonospora sp. MW-13]|uniref:M56 family metallopeptidase n=1 Tax=Micromonospora sp. MW-13 TaxID=2094022 RepID=UPI000EF02C61|nr:M56 family metallopeptidase [Micromonospora sp. MW-13]RGC67765.1 heat shock protein HtpX [Micromonospora sp. MW-13]
MTETPHARAAERVVAAGTTLRFVLLIALLVVASSSMMDSTLWTFSDSSGNGCSLAAGVDPSRSSDLTAIAAVLDQGDAFDACVARYESVPGWWSLAWPAGLLVAAGVLFLGLPAWKARRGRVVPLAAVDQDGEVLRALADLAAAAGLARVPRVVVDPGAASTGAVVFGRNRRPTMCLHGGLLARRTTDPDSFRAVLLHELAHIRNGDVTITYLTVALWRVFVGMVLLPYLAIYTTMFVNALRSPFLVGELPMFVRGFLLTVVLVGLVHLARSDVLRSREVYADLAAVRWGAAPRAWAVTAPDRVGGRLRRIVGRFVELWRTHPRWDLRRDALADPAALFGVRALPMFLTGVATSLFTFQAADILGARDLTEDWALQAMTLVAAVLVTGSVGIVLWRAVTHAVLTARAVPSGVRAGLWLGAGMATSNVVISDLALLQWLPTRPEVLLLVVLVGVVFAWWTAQCAQLWAGVWQGRTNRLVMVLTLTAAGLLLSSWFGWWRLNGVLFAYGWPFDSAGLRQLLEQGRAPGDIAEHSAALSVLAMVGSLLYTLPTRPLELLALAALWVVPLLAWTVRPAGAPAGAVDDAQAAGGALPPLRRALLPGLLTGAAACWVAVVAVLAYLHAWQPLPGQRGVLHVWTYLAWVLVALVAAAMVAAVVASVSASRFRLILALIAAQTAIVVGTAGVLVLASLDGCLGLLGTIRATCDRHPAGALWQEIPFVLKAGPVLAVIASVVATAGVSAVRAARRSTARRTADVPSRVTRRGGLVIRRVGVGVLCAATLAAIALEVTHPAPKRSTGFDASAPQRMGAADQQVASAEVRMRQVSAWMQYGGRDLLERFLTESKGFAEYLAAPTPDASGKPKLDSSVVRSHCLDLDGVARDARAYFRIPDPEAQSYWRTFITQLEQSAQDCARAADEKNGQLLLPAIQELDAARQALGAAVNRIGTVARAGRR